ncbi:sigma-54 interaction domain-containing protein [Spirosoma arcticum]
MTNLVAHTQDKYWIRKQEQRLQADAVTALLTTGNRDEKFIELTKVLQTCIPFDFIHFSWAGPDSEYDSYSLRRISFDEYQLLNRESFLRMTRSTVCYFYGVKQEQFSADTYCFNDIDYIEAWPKQPILKTIATVFNMRSALILTAHCQFTMAMFSTESNSFTEEHTDLIQSLQYSLVMAIERMMAFDEINYLKQKLEIADPGAIPSISATDRGNESSQGDLLIGKSEPILEVHRKIQKIATTDYTVLVLGETGTGKELIAKSIHIRSKRKDKSLIKVNCATLPANLIESELFGHEKGSFTGATEKRIGKFELANRGTIFLDEIGELPLELQPKLLRVLQEKEFERLGSNKSISCDVRIIAATNRNLQEEVKAGRFRADLFFRLNVFPISLPTLSTRQGDIPLLADYFLQSTAHKLGRKLIRLSESALLEMMSYPWPGNIRELEHVIERAAVTAIDDVIYSLSLTSTPISASLPCCQRKFPQTLADSERDLIVQTLHFTKGRIRGKGGAAGLLAIEPNTLDARMKKLGIVKRHVVEGHCEPVSPNGFFQ